MTDIPLQSLPTGTSDFESLRKAHLLYVDKTDMIFRLASARKKFFLTRPRRFGKSLLVSTFESLFRNGLKYFSGLAIEKWWQDTTYNVVRIDFSEVKNIEGARDFYSQLDDLLEVSFKPAGFRRDKRSRVSLLKQLSGWMKAQPGNSLVLLIDEYDSPLTACLENRKLFTSVRKRLASFYASVKASDACLRFLFITGIARFNQTGIFSELNTLFDISTVPAFGTLLGYSEDEIRRYFPAYVRHAADVLKMPTEAVLTRLRENYDGYCFDQNVSTHVFAPWSVMTFFDWPELGFANYWIQSGGTLTLLEQYLHSHALKSPAEYGEELSLSSDELTSSTDLDHLSDLALLTQAGYLTIKRHELDTYYVSYPNREVTSSMAALYAGMLLKRPTVADAGGSNVRSAVISGHLDDFFASVNRTFAAFDYARFPITNEKTCQVFLQILLTCVGFDVVAERHNALGRSDLEFDTQDHHWVIELKFQRRKDDADALLQAAAEQIRDRNYGASSPKPLIRAAAVFSEAKRAFAGWADADAGKDRR